MEVNIGFKKSELVYATIDGGDEPIPAYTWEHPVTR